MASTHDNAGIAANQFVKTVGDVEVKSYAEAKAFLGTANTKKLASNVWVVRKTRTSIAIRLYNTEIITYYSNGTFEANNGGFNTPTTSTRCCQFGPRGWFFYHSNKKLHGGGKEMGTGKKYKCKKSEPSTLATAGVFIG